MFPLKDIGVGDSHLGVYQISTMRVKKLHVNVMIPLSQPTPSYLSSITCLTARIVII